MQERKSNQCKESNSNHCKRARRKDAEPITRRFEMRLSALSFLTTYVIADRLQLIKPLLVGKLRLQH